MKLNQQVIDAIMKGFACHAGNSLLGLVTMRAARMASGRRKNAALCKAFVDKTLEVLKSGPLGV